VKDEPSLARPSSSANHHRGVAQSSDPPSLVCAEVLVRVDL